jgi:nitroreductase
MKKQHLNSTIKTLLTRTCCRNFNNRPVTNNMLKVILQAGQAAPSAKNRQPWFFVVIRNEKCRQEIARAAFIGRQRQFANWNEKKAKEMTKGDAFDHSNDAVIAQAPVAILVFRNSNPKYKEALPAELDIKEEQGVANACFSMMLAAENLGLRSAWICSPLYIIKKLKKILPKYGIDWQETWQPRAILPIGYPATDLTKPARKPLKKVSLFAR